MAINGHLRSGLRYSIHSSKPLSSPVMDCRPKESVRRGDLSTLRKLIDQDENITRPTVHGSRNTVLHLAAKLGHLELAKEIVKLWPEMASVENAEHETPLHEACREGHLEIVKLLLETDRSVAYKVNSQEESILFAACERGMIHVVQNLLNLPRLLEMETFMATTSLHAAASSGNTETAKEIIKARPDFARKKNSHGCTPLHLACGKGHLEMTRELLKLDSELCLIQDGEGRVPLHWAARKGRISRIDEILSVSLESADATTDGGETILHLAVKDNRLEAVKHLIESLNTTELLNMQDNNGNSVLHLAAGGKLAAIGTEVNALNEKGYTALDVVEADASNSGALAAIVSAPTQAGAKRRGQLRPGPIGIQQAIEFNSEGLTEGFQSKSMSRHDRASNAGLQNEGLRNAQKTVTVIAALIASVTFAAGVNPPGGFSQEMGKATRGDCAAFKVFLVFNLLALFQSVGVLSVLVSSIPFAPKTQTKILNVTQKVMLLATLSMAAAHIAAIWTIMPHNGGARWLLGGGCSVIALFGLGLMLAMLWLKEYKKE